MNKKIAEYIRFLGLWQMYFKSIEGFLNLFIFLVYIKMILEGTENQVPEMPKGIFI